VVIHVVLQIDKKNILYLFSNEYIPSGVDVRTAFIFEFFARDGVDFSLDALDSSGCGLDERAAFILVVFTEGAVASGLDAPEPTCCELDE
jgi:hypothetical protein